MLSGIVLSKDRPMQLHLLLESLEKNSNNIFDVSVLYNSSSEEYSEGYEKTRGAFPDITWIHENDFRDDLLNHLKSRSEFICFFTDDNILYRNIEFDFDLLINPFVDFNGENGASGICSVSLRLGSNTVFEYNHNAEINIDFFPQLHKYIPGMAEMSRLDTPTGKIFPISLWQHNAFNPLTNFGYPMSVDAHVFQRGFIEPYLNGLNFNNPNSMESEMVLNSKNCPALLGCLDLSYVVNTPINRVQDTFQNSYGKNFGISQKDLNDKYLSEQVIDYDRIDFSNVIGCHQELKMEFKKYDRPRRLEQSA